MTITETTTIADIASQLPTSVRVFQRHGIDFCCGGKKPIGAVCREHGLDFADIARAIEGSRATADSDTRDWLREPLSTLTAHIVTVYHQPLRDELPRLQTMAEKVARGEPLDELEKVQVQETDLHDSVFKNIDLNWWM